MANAENNRKRSAGGVDPRVAVGSFTSEDWLSTEACNAPRRVEAPRCLPEGECYR